MRGTIMANVEQKKSTLAADLTASTNFLDEPAVKDRVDLLHEAGDIPDVRGMLQEVIKKCASPDVMAGSSNLWLDPGDFQKEGIDAIDECEIDMDLDNPDNDCKFARLLHDTFNGREGVELPSDVTAYYSNGNGREVV